MKCNDWYSDPFVFSVNVVNVMRILSLDNTIRYFLRKDLGYPFRKISMNWTIYGTLSLKNVGGMCCDLFWKRWTRISLLD